MKRENDSKFKWNVWVWDFNHDDLESYDVVPMFVRWLDGLKGCDRPMSRDALSEEMLHCASYHFWAKCEYELIIEGWPQQKNERKVDVYNQLKLNWDHFVDAFWTNVWEKETVVKTRRSRREKS